MPISPITGLSEQGLSPSQGISDVASAAVGVEAIYTATGAGGTAGTSAGAGGSGKVMVWI